MHAFITILVIVFLLLLSLILPMFLQKRAVKAVLKIFQGKNALETDSALTRDELGLKPQTFMGRMLKMRDYKPAALNFLLSANIVRETEEERLYFSEERLTSLYNETNSKMLRFILPSRIP